MTAEERFREWLLRQMPPGTIVSDPNWWARRIFAHASSCFAPRWSGMPDPLTPGWYWVNEPEVGPMIVNVVRTVDRETGADSDLMVHDPFSGDLEEPSSYAHAEWSGPIPLPLAPPGGGE